MDQRAAFRYPTNLPAECSSGERSWSSSLRNISTTGCMFACEDGSVVPGTRLRIRIRGLPMIEAVVIWQHRGHAGIHFAKALRPCAMEHLGFSLPQPVRASAA